MRKSPVDIAGSFTSPISGLLLGSFLLLPSVHHVHAQDADFIGLLKTQNFVQIRPHIVSLATDEYADPLDAPLTFEAYVEGVGPGSLSGATLDLPSPPGGSAALTDADEPPLQRQFSLTGGFDTFGEFNRDFPDGTYTFEITGASDSPPVHMVPLDLSADATGTYRGVTKFTAPVFQSAQAINPAQPFTFRWGAILRGSASDYVLLFILDASGMDIYYSPDLGEPGALNGTSTSFTVPAGVFSPGAHYTVFLGVFHLADIEMSYAPAVSAFGKTISMEIHTTGGVDITPPSFVRAIPRVNATGIATNTIVTFVFGEPMDTSVNPAQAVTWTGVANPTLFSYRWSPDATRLFCQYGPGLPTATAITWAVNPAGSAAKLRDAAGNIMTGSRTGGFQTAPTSNFGIPDVSSLVLYRSKSFFQSSGGILDLNDYSAGFGLEFGGLCTVSSVDLGIPGGALETALGEFSQDYLAIDGVARFAEPGDLTSILPDGNYTLGLHTFHDGLKSVTLNMASGTYPDAPTVKNHSATQSIDGSQDFVLQWNAWSGGTSNDRIFVRVTGDTGMAFFESPGMGEPSALDGTATSVTIPAESMPPGSTLEAEIIFAKVIAGDTTQYPGVPVASSRASVTKLNFQTIGDPFEPRLEILSWSASQVKLRLTAVFGSYFQIQSGPSLPPTNAVWSGRVLGSPSGYRASFDYTDYTVSGVPKRFYQAHGIEGNP